mmetsp:Transcript_8236/g.17557  ORF Transcript_8236/g.17557 Transcript_8236/m.17557 type:complete len:257 (-) Transcript_8236:1302-2072(-)
MNAFPCSPKLNFGHSHLFPNTSIRIPLPIIGHIARMTMMQLIPPLPPEFRPIRNLHLLAIHRIIAPIVNNPLLVVIVVLLLLLLPVGIQPLQIRLRKKPGKHIRPYRDQDHQQRRINVPHGRKIGHGKDSKRASQLNRRKQLHRRPLNVRDHRHRRSLLGDHETKDGSLPNLVSVQCPDAQVEQESEEGPPRNPGNDLKGPQGHEHEEGLSQSRPALLFHVRDDFPLDAVSIRFQFPRAERPDVEGGLGDQSVSRG